MRLKNKNGYVNAAFGPQPTVEIRNLWVCEPTRVDHLRGVVPGANARSRALFSAVRESPGGSPIHFGRIEALKTNTRQVAHPKGVEPLTF